MKKIALLAILILAIAIQSKAQSASVAVNDIISIQFTTQLTDTPANVKAQVILE